MLILKFASYLFFFCAYIYAMGNIVVRAEDAEVKGKRAKMFALSFLMIAMSLVMLMMATNEVYKWKIN